MESTLPGRLGLRLEHLVLGPVEGQALLRVTPGVFDDAAGLVQVSGTGLAAGELSVTSLIAKSFRSPVPVAGLVEPLTLYRLNVAELIGVVLLTPI